MADFKVLRISADGSGYEPVVAPDVAVADILAATTFVVPSGAAFPGAPLSGELFWHTGDQTLYRYNGSSWEQVKGDADGVAEALGDITGNPHGFLNQTDTTISFVDGTRTFTIAPTGADFSYYYQGNHITKASPENKVIGNTDGIHFIYYDATATLQESLLPWDLEIHVPVATVHWNTILAKGCVGEERHTVQMDWRTHKYLHQANGTRYISGLTASGYTLNLDTDAAVTIGVGDGYIYDEDIEINPRNAAIPSQRFEQVLADPAEIPVCYRQTTTGIWRQDAPTAFYFTNGVGGLINYNEWTGSQWQPTEATNGYHVAYWIVATNNIVDPIVSVMGQRQDNNLPDAKENNVLANMDWGVFPFQESRLLYRIILQTGTAYGGTRKVKIQDVVDYRTIQNLPTGSFVPIDHSSLGGLATSGHPATVIENNTTSFAGVLSTADTTAQLAFDTLDDHRHLIKSNVVAAGSFAGTPRTATVTFTTPYPDTNYSISTQAVSIANTAFSISIESKATTGFVINTNTNNITNLTEVTWMTIPYGG